MEQLPPDATVILSRQRRFYSKLIYRAICDIVNYRDAKRPASKEIYKSAYEWMYNGFKAECENEEMRRKLQEFDDALSFETACSMLSWDPDWVRRRVAKLTKADLEHIGRNGLI